MSSAHTGADEYSAEVFISGGFESPASDWLPVFDKAAGEAFARYGNASAAQVDRAVAAAKQAQPAWADTDANTRCDVLRAFAAELDRRHDELISLIIRETGGTAEKAEEELGQSITVQGSDAGGYGILNLTLFSQNLIKNLEFSASVYNVLDRRYSDPASHFHVQDTIEQNGRTFRIKLTYRF